MKQLSLDDLESRADDWNEVVVRTPNIDTFCSSTHWILPAHRGLMPPREAWIMLGDAGGCALARNRDPQYGVYLEPLEAMWGMASPFVGSEPTRIVMEAFEALGRDESWRLLLLSGLSLTGSFLRDVVTRKPHHWHLLPATTMGRRRASLEGGYEGYASRRSAGFRRNLGRAFRKAELAGVEFEVVVESEGAAEEKALFDRIIDVEKRSWKGLGGIGIEEGRMREFYRLMLPHLTSRGALRTVFARRDGRDLAYHFGGVFGDTYRGLQHSFDEQFRTLSLGALTHATMIQAVCDEGLTLYDLGQDTPYKARWAESVFETVTLVLAR